MELALLVYLVSMLEPVSRFLTTFIGISGFIAIASIIAYCSLRFIGGPSIYSWTSDPETEKIQWASNQKFSKKIAVISVISVTLFSTLQVVVPTERTAYIMLGAYATQKVAEDPRTQEIGNKILKIVNVKLDQYVTDLTAKVSK